MIRVIPPDQQEKMTLMTTSGFEINIQMFLRLEEQYLVCRGRMMGSTDAGLTFFVPYDQINCLFYNKMAREETILAWFTEPPAFEVTLPPPKDAASAPVPTEPAPETAPAPAPVPAPAAGPAPPPGAKPLQPAARPAVATPAKPPAVPTRPVAPAPAPAPAAPQAQPGGSSVPINAGMALPAKQAMIDRLRKRSLGVSSQGTTPRPNLGSDSNPPEQK